MNNLRLNGILMLFALVFAFSACSEDGILSSEGTVLPQNEQVKMPAHRVFPSTKAFLKELSTPVAETASDLSFHPNATESFVSYADYFDNLEGEIAELEALGRLPNSINGIAEKFGVMIEADDYDETGFSIAPKIRGPRMGGIANQFGVYQVGDLVYQRTYRELLSAKEGDVLDFSDLSTAINVERQPVNEEVSTKGLEIEERCIRDYTANGGLHRLRTTWYADEQSDGGAQTIELFIEIKHQKKGIFGIWFANQEERIWSDGRIMHHVSGDGTNTTRFDVDHEVFNDSKLIIDIHSGGRNSGLDEFDRWVAPVSWALHSCRDQQWSSNCQITVQN